MKKALIFLALIALQFTVTAQGISTYEIDPIKKDSFFLREIITGATTADFPRPQTTETNILYRSPDALLKLVDDLKKKADENDKQAQKLALEAKQSREMAQKIDEAINRQKSFFFEKPKFNMK